MFEILINIIKKFLQILVIYYVTRGFFFMRNYLYSRQGSFKKSSPKKLKLMVIFGSGGYSYLNLIIILHFIIL